MVVTKMNGNRLKGAIEHIPHGDWRTSVLPAYIYVASVPALLNFLGW